jgi:F-type H+-transporting ATPase subunit epsilon
LFKTGKVRSFMSPAVLSKCEDDQVSVLADVAERPEEIDVAGARATRERLEKQLTGWSGSEDDLELARTELARSEVRLQLASARG